MATKSDQKTYPDCELKTKHYRLTIEDSERAEQLAGGTGSLLQSCGRPECALVVLLSAVAVPVGSAVVSGSIVVVGNTVHWLEAQGVCDSSITQQALDQITASAQNLGGWVVESADQFWRLVTLEP